ncbi:Glyoxylase, beta-lactamase superfamily II [Reichenbachiella faecimaris]|uniref:Glyoxylase, beta-lactamase superfamily II n=1 Tax=Reichenbachiella faecimaris TaxID=692418 RepID=A0A1W2GES8_REIFA|nr:MBL fold metallo-hydrolase [Reichenbachiella faecimaris]SMD34766.1 Glyoxylase, beta-lactamase superfamily II [Reichenbachiella faecimaris]
MPEIKIIDLHFKNLDHAIASYLLPSTDGPILIETGPHATFPKLKEGVEALGYQMTDIKHVFLTHIHLDHAGAAWALAETGAKIYLHPFGAKNMEDPSRLMESATRIYGDQMDTLWGQMKPIPADQLIQVEDGQSFEIGELKIKSLHTPGHAKHHIAWQVEEIIFTGDVAGVKIDNGPVVPPCPPPDINLEDWKTSLNILRQAKPTALYLTHYNKITAIDSHLSSLKLILDDWAVWIKKQMQAGLTNEEMVPMFMEYTADQLREAGLDESTIQLYEAANPSWMSVAGLVRYWTKKES